jgi:hypothetical protein
MLIIITPADLRRVADTPRLPPALVDTLDDWYWSVWRAVDGEIETFSLADIGPIAVLEPDDPPTVVPGLCRKVTEWCDVVDIGGVDYYDAGILAGNSCCHRILGRVGALHPAVEAYLACEAHGR